MAQAFAKVGQQDSARVYNERYLKEGGTFRVYSDAWYLAATYQQLGEI